MSDQSSLIEPRLLRRTESMLLLLVHNHINQHHVEFLCDLYIDISSHCDWMSAGE